MMSGLSTKPVNHPRQPISGIGTGPVYSARWPTEQDLGRAPLAQSAERLHGKEKVYGSIP